MRLLGQLEHGVYVDDLDDVPPEDLIEHYGVDEDNVDDHIGEGDSDSDDDDYRGDGYAGNNVEDGPEPGEITVNVPETHTPFTDDDMENIFHQSLEEIREHGIVPVGYGIFPHEWEEEHYPTVESIRTGRRGGREIVVGLADDIWRPRATVWVQGLSVLTQLQDMYE